MEELHKMAQKAYISIDTATYIFAQLNAHPSKYTLIHASCTALRDQIYAMKTKLRFEKNRIWEEGQKQIDVYQKIEFDELFLQSTGIDLNAE